MSPEGTVGNRIRAILTHQDWSLWPADGTIYLGALLLAFAAESAIHGDLLSLQSLPHIVDVAFPIAFALCLVGVNTVLGMYHRDGDVPTQNVYLLAATALTLDMTIVYMAIRSLVPSSVHYASSAPPFNLLLFSIAVGAIRPILFVLREKHIGQRRVLILGSGDGMRAVGERLQKRPQREVKLVGVLATQAPDSFDGSLAGFAVREFVPGSNLLDLVQQLKVTDVIVASTEQRGGVLPMQELLACRIRGVRVSDLTAFYERWQGEFPIESLKASWLIYGRGFEQGWACITAKRALDIAASVVLLLVSIPAMLMAAIAIRLESAGPVIYRQERVGQGGRTFQILKFRSMSLTAEKDGVARWAGAGDARITRVGHVLRRTRIDELPQLFNVLRGEMSVVGPRPERPTFVDQLRNEVRFYDVRHSVKPGLTGWAQVRFAYAASIEDSQRKLQYDLYYVKNHSTLLDLRILFETVRVVLRGEGAR
jgi:sugar transferase (PEP-CTERM system associated)